MRYVIGTNVPKSDGTISEGLYAYDKSYGLAFILTKENRSKYKDGLIEVFDSLEEVNEQIVRLRHAYHNEFKSRAKKLNVGMSAFKFYPLKLDSSNLSYIRLTKKRDNKKIKWSLYEYEVKE